MIWPAWLWIGTPLKFSVWMTNRLATWTGSFYVWKRARSKQRVWMWLSCSMPCRSARCACFSFGFMGDQRRSAGRIGMQSPG